MKMQVAWFHRFGEPEEMVLEETQCPIPGPGEALVRVRATGVNHVDLDVRAGTARVRSRSGAIVHGSAPAAAVAMSTA